MNTNKIQEKHLNRPALVYIRQSSTYQVENNNESKRLQYGLVDRVKNLGWQEVDIIDEDMGRSGSGMVVRKGFDRLIASVSMGKAGAVVSFDASRLARNNRDWHMLIDMCSIVGTIIIDQDNVYDPLIMNDRLLLGLKGTMSEFELGLLRQRAQQAIHQKASRGEFLNMVATGYFITDDNRCEKDPNQRIQEAIGEVFIQFKRLGSARKVFSWFHQEGIELPRRQEKAMEWKLPSYGAIHKILTNPVYAGAYAWGRTQTESKVVSKRLRKRAGVRIAMEQWKVLIKNHHDGYINWEQYIENQKRLKENAIMNVDMQTPGVARNGKSLLAGLLRCGNCGRGLYVRYKGNCGEVLRYLCQGSERIDGKKGCICFSGKRADMIFEEKILEIIRPAAIEASIRAAQRISEVHSEKRKSIALALKQSEYEQHRAFRQYDAVDPDNRLVASQLEKRWNEAILKVRKIEAELADIDQLQKSMNDIDKSELLGLSDELPLIWRDPRCDMVLKKMIVRTLVHHVVVDKDNEEIVFTIYWKGGDHSQFRISHSQSGKRNKTDRDTVRIIRELNQMMKDCAIANTLNRLGRKTAQGKGWTEKRIKSIRRYFSIPAYNSQKRIDEGIMTLTETASYLGISAMSTKRLIENGVIKSSQIVKYAPHIIKRTDLENESVREAVTGIKNGIKRPLPADPNQLTLKFQ